MTGVATAFALTACGSGSHTAGTTIPSTTSSSASQVSSSSASASRTNTSAGPVASVTAIKPATGTPLSRAKWLVRGDAICARLNAQLAASPIKSLSEFARVLPQAAGYERAELSQLALLVPPARYARDWEEILTATSQWAADNAKLGEVAQTQLVNLELPLAKASEKAHVKLATIAKRDGFKECSLI